MLRFPDKDRQDDSKLVWSLFVVNEQIIHHMQEVFLDCTVPPFHSHIITPAQ